MSRPFLVAFLTILVAGERSASADLTNRNYLPFGERASMLGNAGFTSPQGEAVYYNPGNLARIDYPSLSVSGTTFLLYDLSLDPRRRATLEKVVGDLYPKGGDLARAEFWTGLRPATPDGTPVVGATGLRNLFLNTGHGTLGWTMACGSGRYLADVIACRPTGIGREGLDISRYGGGRIAAAEPIEASPATMAR